MPQLPRDINSKSSPTPRTNKSNPTVNKNL
jgi:hypothetical protein